MKIGVHVATHNRPHLIRSLVLQLQNQTLKPDLLCIHNNGIPKSYEWIIHDLRVDFEIKWIHNPEKLQMKKWYSVPLKYLLDQNCTHYFYCDDDDFYYNNHIESTIEIMSKEQCDFTIRKNIDIVYLKNSGAYIDRNVWMTSHAPGGMSSSMCFNKAFAQELYNDYEADTIPNKYQYNDHVIKYETMPKFRCHFNTNISTAYFSHENSLTSSGWVRE